MAMQKGKCWGHTRQKSNRTNRNRLGEHRPLVLQTVWGEEMSSVTREEGVKLILWLWPIIILTLLVSHNKQHNSSITAQLESLRCQWWICNRYSPSLVPSPLSTEGAGRCATLSSPQEQAAWSAPYSVKNSEYYPKGYTPTSSQGEPCPSAGLRREQHETSKSRRQ